MPNCLATPPTRCFLRHLAATAFLLASFLAGCSREVSPTIRVEGQITYRGEPVTQGVVSFVPSRNAVGRDLRPAAAALQPDGTYRLSASRDVDGVLPGSYAVAVAAYRDAHLLPGRKIEYAAPAKYANPHTSGLTATVPADAAGPVRLDFQLRD
jgi:hypothetical protein